MPIYVLLVVLAIALAVIFGLKMKKSLKFDHLVKDITETVDVAPKTSDGIIKDIGAAEKALEKDAKALQVEVDKLTKQSAKIGDYLANKGVTKPAEKRKETDSG